MTGLEAFEPRDFVVFGAAYRSSADYDEHRLRIRRRLAAIAEAAKRRLAALGLPLERRDSLHRPHGFNRGRVVAQWVYLMRDAGARRAFRSKVGPEVGADLDPAFQNAHFCVAIDEAGLEVGLRLHAQAWIDAQNLKNAGAGAAGWEAWRDCLRGLPEGFGLRIHDWRKVYACARMTRDDAEEFFRYFVAGEHGTRVFRPIPKEHAAAISNEFPARAADDLVALAPVYRFVAWSPENDRLGLRA